jgi:hypothetical protein
MPIEGGGTIQLNLILSRFFQFVRCRDRPSFGGIAISWMPTPSGGGRGRNAIAHLLLQQTERTSTVFLVSLDHF